MSGIGFLGSKDVFMRGYWGLVHRDRGNLVLALTFARPLSPLVLCVALCYE